MLAQTLGERLGEVAAGAVVGEDLVTTGSFDGGGQGPGAGDLDLQRAFVLLGLLLERVEILAEQRGGPALVDSPTTAGEPPAGWLHISAELDQAQGPPDHVRVRATAGELGQVWQRQVAEYDAQGLVEVARVVTRHRADTAGQRHARPVDAIVHEPTTRVPS